MLFASTQRKQLHFEFLIQHLMVKFVWNSTPATPAALNRLQAFRLRKSVVPVARESLEH